MSAVTATVLIVGLFAVLANFVVVIVWITGAQAAERRDTGPATHRLEAERAMVDFDREWKRFNQE